MEKKKAQNGETISNFCSPFASTANETFLDVKEDSFSLIVAVMLTKKRLPERFEIFCCCICLFTAYFSFFVCTSLCEYNFMCCKIYIGMAKKEFIFIIHHFAVETRARDPEKKSPLSALHLKSHFRFLFCCGPLSRWDILWQQLVIFIFVNIHIMSWLSFCEQSSFFDDAFYCSRDSRRNMIFY